LLRKAFRDHRPAKAAPAEPTAEEKAAALAEAREGCASLRADPQVLRSGVELVAKLGVVGETSAVTAVILTMISCLTAKPNALILQGASSGGKSTVMLTATRLMPPERLTVLTTLSPKSLIYSDRDFRHSLIVLQEAAPLRVDSKNSDVAHMLRVLLSEGRLIHEKVELVDDVLKTVTIEKAGPVGLLTCNVADQMDAELSTRVISIGIDGGADQTAEVITRAAIRAAGQDNQGDYSAEIAEWHCFIRWLAGQSTAVTIPFAPALRELIKIAQTRTRRDFEQVLSMIRASAILHREHRKIVEGRIFATVADYEAAYMALHVAVEVAAERQPAVELLRLLDMIREMMAEATASQSAALPPGMAFHPRPDTQTQLTISVRKLAEKLHMSKSSVQRLVKQAKADGFLRDREDRSGVPMILELGDAVTETVTEDPVLPTPDQLAQHLAGETESR
ncbi:MAG TPA: helix-turn-helix domain-containing protein, partial [Paracoccus sp. (in: a-proteobacteria)]|uniref:MarR family transcriptional regulator n=1 Tax=Paracoccus sp. TaxID=267 RepID=UPI002B559B90